VNDPILNVVPSAVRALKSGFSFGGGSEQEIIFLSSRTGDPVTDHGLLNPTYLEALLWEGRRYQSLYLSPLSSSVLWFPNFAYEVTRRIVLAVLWILIMLREFIRSAVKRVLDPEKESHVPVPSLKSTL